MQLSLQNLKHGRTIKMNKGQSTKNILLGINSRLNGSEIERMPKHKIGSDMKDFIKSNTQTYVPNRKAGLEYGIDFAQFNKNSGLKNDKTDEKDRKITNNTDEKSHNFNILDASPLKF